MTIKSFLNELEEILLSDDELTLDSDLTAIEEWDSLAVMSVMSLFQEKLSIVLTTADFKNIKTPNDIILLSKGKIA